MSVINVKIINPDQVLFDGEASLVFAPGKIGTLGIMPDHSPMFAELIKGEIFIQGEKEAVISLESGILKVKDNNLLILISGTE